ncbi:hypothetical protein D9M72_581410 [compost metagenome]
MGTGSRAIRTHRTPERLRGAHVDFPPGGCGRNAVTEACRPLRALGQPDSEDRCLGIAIQLAADQEDLFAANASHRKQSGIGRCGGVHHVPGSDDGSRRDVPGLQRGGRAVVDAVDGAVGTANQNRAATGYLHLRDIGHAGGRAHVDAEAIERAVETRLIRLKRP